MGEIFDELISRENTDCAKYDDRLKRFGRPDVLPMWVADMDFRAPDCVRQALQPLVDQNLYGYHMKAERYYRAIVDWWARRHRWTGRPLVEAASREDPRPPAPGRWHRASRARAGTPPQPGCRARAAIRPRSAGRHHRRRRIRGYPADGLSEDHRKGHLARSAACPTAPRSGT